MIPRHHEDGMEYHYMHLHHGVLRSMTLELTLGRSVLYWEMATTTSPVPGQGHQFGSEPLRFLSGDPFAGLAAATLEPREVVPCLSGTLQPAAPDSREEW